MYKTQQNLNQHTAKTTNNTAKPWIPYSSVCPLFPQ